MITTQKTQAERDALAAKQQAIAVRLECLKMSVSLGGTDVRVRAEDFEDYVMNGKPAPVEDVPPA